MVEAEAELEILPADSVAIEYTPFDDSSRKRKAVEEQLAWAPVEQVAAVDTDLALARLEAEVTTRGPDWRISYTLVLAAPWDERWHAGVWVCSRTGQSAQAEATRRNMTPAQMQRFEALPYGELILFDTDDKLARLEAEVARRGPAWCIPQRLVLAAPWDERWRAGRWVDSRTGQGAQAVASRRNMTPAQRSRLEALPYGSERH